MIYHDSHLHPFLVRFTNFVLPHLYEITNLFRCGLEGDLIDVSTYEASW